MKLLRLGTIALTRLFISLVFLTGAVHKLLNWHSEECSWMETLCDWQAYVWFWDQGESFFGMLSHSVPLLLIAATLFELLGGLLILLAVKEKLGAFLLLVVLFLTTIIFYPFWFQEGDVREMQIALFLKNLAIAGALLLVLLNGIQPAQPMPSRGPQ